MKKFEKSLEKTTGLYAWNRLLLKCSDNGSGRFRAFGGSKSVIGYDCEVVFAGGYVGDGFYDGGQKAPKINKNSLKMFYMALYSLKSLIISQITHNIAHN